MPSVRRRWPPPGLIRPALAAGLMGLAGCSSASPGATARPGTPGTPAGPFASPAVAAPGPSFAPLVAPAVVGATPARGGAPATTPPVTPRQFSFVTPTGWVISGDSGVTQVHLVRGALGSPESIFMDSAPGVSGDQAPPLRQVDLGGERGNVIQDGAVNSEQPGYNRIIQVVHGGRLYELRCLGYAGYEKARLLAGCDQFAASLKWT